MEGSGRWCVFFLMRRRPPRSTLFPYTTLVRSRRVGAAVRAVRAQLEALQAVHAAVAAREVRRRQPGLAARRALGPVDRKSTRLNSSHANISYAVFCLKKKKPFLSHALAVLPFN